MRYYESLYIVNPNYENDRLEKEIDIVTKKAVDLGFKKINHRPWGKKRLAYVIDGHKYGSYIIFQFETESIDSLGEFERFMVLNNSVIRNQVISLDTKPKVKTDLDSSDTSSENSKEEDIEKKDNKDKIEKNEE